MMSIMQSYLEKIDESSIRWIEDTIIAEPDITRSQLADRFSKQLKWQAPNGRYKKTESAIVMQRLERIGLLSLPEPRKIACNNPACRKELEPYNRSELNGTLPELGDIRLVMVNGEPEQSRLWRRLVESHHPLQNSHICGAQIRYLVECSTAGLLGALSFSSPALRLAARDRWIGWNDRVRAEQLEQVINNSRFLILPQIHVPHLASHVLAMACRQVADDWETMYAVRPVLVETFVDSRRYRGTCYRAANWIHVGTTSGRGRQDTGDISQAKDIYCLPLQSDFRRQLGGKEPLPVDWTEEEFGQVDLGDRRLKKRLFHLAQSFYANPLANIPQACGNKAATKAAYRFFKHPAVKLESTLASHYAATAQRIRNHKGIILAVQDTTSLNYHSHPSTKDLGPIDAKGTQGLLVHDTMAFTEEGVPIGLVDVQYWAREEAKNRTVLESEKWLASFKATEQIRESFPKKLIVSVGDREADFFDLFAAVRPGGTQLLVRAMHCRSLVEDETNIWIHMQRCPLAGKLDIHIPARPGSPARTAKLSVSFDKVTVQPPKNKNSLESVVMWAVLARETDPPERVEPLEWLLLTSVAVDTFEAACERISWYTKRWGIEIFHRTFKSGCKTEERQLGTADRLAACLAVDMVVAWRVYYLTKLGRETPDVPCTVFFEEDEWKALSAHATKNPIPPAQPPTLHEAMLMVAKLGGYLGRKSDGPPGTTTIWRGTVGLGWITEAWRVFAKGHGPPQAPD